MAKGRQCVVGYRDQPPTLPKRQTFLRKGGNHSSVIGTSQELNAPKQRRENLKQDQSISSTANYSNSVNHILPPT
jgi:hypothetical protein